ncbi:MAG: 4Fe-4S binding protein [Candidatus Marinimicrobia bacterium]|nr:4Fe-4S binding protein [Candidatus Neomarinimicrobiota bacterium]
MAVIDPGICTACGKCADRCRFDAVKITNGRYTVECTGLRGMAATVQGYVP